MSDGAEYAGVGDLDELRLDARSPPTTPSPTTCPRTAPNYRRTHHRRKSNRLYGGSPGDDTTIAVARVQPSFGQPRGRTASEHKEDDVRMMNLFSPRRAPRSSAAAPPATSSPATCISPSSPPRLSRSGGAPHQPHHGRGLHHRRRHHPLQGAQIRRGFSRSGRACPRLVHQKTARVSSPGELLLKRHRHQLLRLPRHQPRAPEPSTAHHLWHQAAAHHRPCRLPQAYGQAHPPLLLNPDGGFITYAVIRHLCPKACHKVPPRRSRAMPTPGTAPDCYPDIPKVISPVPGAPVRCCIYKSAIVAEREDRHGRGGQKPQRHRGHRHRLRRMSQRQRLPRRPRTAAAVSRTAAPASLTAARSPLTKTTTRRSILTSRINCASAPPVCPYSAIQNHVRLLRARLQGQGHPAGRKSRGAHRRQQMPPAARAFIAPLWRHSGQELSDAIRILRKRGQQKYKVHAVVAPSISRASLSMPSWASDYGPQGAGLQRCEAALGADMVAYREARSWPRRASSPPAAALPSSATSKELPTLASPSSATTFPMAEVARFIKGTDPMPKSSSSAPARPRSRSSSARRSARGSTALTSRNCRPGLTAGISTFPSLSEDVLDNASHSYRIRAQRWPD